MPQNLQPPGELTLTTTHPESGGVILHVGGDLDVLTAPSLDAAIVTLLVDSSGPVVLDLSSVPFFGSSALAVLIRAAEAAEARRTKLLLVASNRAVLRPLEVTRTVDLFSIHESVEAALQAL